VRQLAVNFEARGIIDWLNEGFDEILGRAAGGPRFDPTAGTVRLQSSPPGQSHEHAAIHVLRSATPRSKSKNRDVEGEALAHYLLPRRGQCTQDRRSAAGGTGRPKYGDIAIMIIATRRCILTSELDRIGIPHVVRGGVHAGSAASTIHLACGRSDPADGVMKAACSPFFAVSPRTSYADAIRNSKRALEATDTLITELRHDRHRAARARWRTRLERTGLVAMSPRTSTSAAASAPTNSAACWMISHAGPNSTSTASPASRGRTDAPLIRSPLPVDANAVQVITAHQARPRVADRRARSDGRASCYP
jgi:hypothetical protein